MLFLREREKSMKLISCPRLNFGEELYHVKRDSREDGMCINLVAVCGLAFCNAWLTAFGFIFQVFACYPFNSAMFIVLLTHFAFE